MKQTIVFFNASPADRAFYPDALKDHQLIFVDGDVNTHNLSAAHDAQVISVRNSSRLPADTLAKMPQLTHIACRTTGFDNLDLAYARAHDITISTVPAYGEATVAEYAVMLLLALTRRLHAGEAAVRTGASGPETLMGHDLAGKTLSIIGTGRIGRHMARIARGFGLTVLAYDIYPNDAAAAEIGYQYAPLNDVLAAADYLSLHAPATPQTRHLLNRRSLTLTKPGVFIINTSRGSLIDTPALLEALVSGRVAGAGLDVLEGEEYLRLEPEVLLARTSRGGQAAAEVVAIDALLKLPNVIITTHNAYNTTEALKRIRQTTAANITAVLNARPQNLVS